jgi:hypothetical protein
MDRISYVAKWTAFGRAVFVEQANLSHPLILGEAEPACGFGWRPENSGDTIAEALLLHATGDEALAARLRARFAADVIAELPPAGFRLDRGRVLGWVANVAAECPPRLRLIQGGYSGPDRPTDRRRRSLNRRRRSAADPSRRAA